ncbi:unnamed protein product [Leuciscus chuanchicus]
MLSEFQCATPRVPSYLDTCASRPVCDSSSTFIPRYLRFSSGCDTSSTVIPRYLRFSSRVRHLEYLHTSIPGLLVRCATPRVPSYLNNCASHPGCDTSSTFIPRYLRFSSRVRHLEYLHTAGVAHRNEVSHTGREVQVSRYLHFSSGVRHLEYLHTSITALLIQGCDTSSTFIPRYLRFSSGVRHLEYLHTSITALLIQGVTPRVPSYLDTCASRPGCDTSSTFIPRYLHFSSGVRHLEYLHTSIPALLVRCATPRVPSYLDTCASRPGCDTSSTFIPRYLHFSSGCDTSSTLIPRYLHFSSGFRNLEVRHLEYLHTSIPALLVQGATPRVPSYLDTCTSRPVCDTLSTLIPRYLHFSSGFRNLEYLDTCVSRPGCDTSSTFIPRYLRFSSRVRHLEYLHTSIPALLVRCATP